jgi:hypothetical protein
MAGKSQTQQQLDELEKVVARLGLLSEVTQKELTRVDSKLAILEVINSNYAVFSRDLDELRRSVEEMKRTREEAGKQWWMLAPPIIGAIASVLLSALVTYLMNRK